MLKRCTLIGAATLLGIAASHAHAIERTFSATLGTIDVQEPASRFNAATPGDAFTTTFGYGDTAADVSEPVSCDVSLHECEWIFSQFANPQHGSTLTGGGGGAEASTVSIFVQNDRPLPADEAEIFSALLGEVVTPGTEVDAWIAEAIEDGAFFSFDEFFNEILHDGVIWQVVYITRDTTLYDEPSGGEIAYRPQPPSIDQVDLAVLLLLEADADGNETFVAVAYLAPPDPIYSALLPTARAVQVGGTASAFVTIANASGNPQTACGISPLTSVTADFLYQETDPSTNALTGTADTPVDIPAGASQTYAIFLEPTAAFAPTIIDFDYSCASGAAATTIAGVNTLLLYASDTPVPDIVALAASSPPGQVVLDAVSTAGAFSVATVNVGASAVLNISATTSTDATLRWCETDPGLGTCINPTTPTSSPLDVAIGAGETPTFAVFAFGSATPIPFDPAANRVYFQVRDDGGNLVGETSVAISGP